MVASLSRTVYLPCSSILADTPRLNGITLKNGTRDLVSDSIGFLWSRSYVPRQPWLKAHKYHWAKLAKNVLFGWFNSYEDQNWPAIGIVDLQFLGRALRHVLGWWMIDSILSCCVPMRVGWSILLEGNKPLPCCVSVQCQSWPPACSHSLKLSKLGETFFGRFANGKLVSPIFQIASEVSANHTVSDLNSTRVSPNFG